MLIAGAAWALRCATLNGPATGGEHNERNSGEHGTRKQRMRIVTTVAAGGLLVLAAVIGSGPVVPAHADSGQEMEACRLMDDPAGAEMGLTPAEYAFMQLRATMLAQQARDVMSEGAQDYCPNHITDLPAGWR
jgi:hypothetical protein